MYIKFILLFLFIGFLKGDDHICNKLSFGLFRQILLKSISYYNGENALLIFESESMYTLLKNDFSGLEQINVPQNSNDWYFLLPGFKERNGKKLKAISFVGWKANSWFFITNAYRFVNILYDHSNYMIENEKISEQDWSFNQPYQIIGKHTNDDTVGMVASYNSTFGFIFYQFTFDKTTHKLNNIPFSSSSMNMLKLIRTGNPNEVLLTDVGYQTEIDYGQLFHKMPIGYLIRNSAILFDTELHCVYIIENLMKHVKQFSVKSGDSKQNHIKLHRNNIPYEKFFKCDNDLSKVEHTLGKFRCDLEYKSNEHLNKNDESLIEEENEVKPVVQSNDKRLWLNLLTTISNNWITFVVGGIVSFVLLLFIIILFVYRKQTVNYRKSTVRKLLNRSPKTKKVKNTSYNSTSKPTTSGKGSYKNQTTT